MLEQAESSEGASTSYLTIGLEKMVKILMYLLGVMIMFFISYALIALFVTLTSKSSPIA